MSTLLEQLFARLSAEETADYSVQIMFTILLQVATNKGTFTLVGDESSETLIKHAGN